MQIHRKAAAAGIGALLAAGVVGGGFALTQGGNGSTGGSPLVSNALNGNSAANDDSTSAIVSQVAAKLGVDASKLNAALTQASPSSPNFLDALAKALGIDTAALKAALKTAGTDVVNQEIANGTLTQEQGQRILDMITTTDFGFLNTFPIGRGGHGGPGFRGPGGPGIPGGMFGMRPETFTAVADALGITEDELHTELRDGKTLAQVGEAHGKSRADLEKLLTDTANANIDRDLAGGKITQAQADEAKAKVADSVTHVLDDTLPVGKGPDDGPHRGGPRDGSGAQPPATPTQPSQPSTSPSSGSGQTA